MRKEVFEWNFLGSTMFAAISSLLKFLKKSFRIENNQDEQQFQTAVIDGIGNNQNNDLESRELYVDYFPQEILRRNYRTFK
jgi:hypothetical protein